MLGGFQFSSSIGPHAGVGRCFDGIFKRPSVPQAPSDSSVRNARIRQVFGLHQRHLFSFVDNVSVVALVVVLLLFGGPLAIGWFVVFIVILAFQSMANGWSKSHVSIKVIERLPSFTNRNAATTIPLISNCFRIGATLDHARPRQIFRTSGHPVPIVSFGSLFSSQASARFGFAIAQGKAAGDGGCSTVASAVPPSVPVAVAVCTRKHKQSSEPLSGHVFVSCLGHCYLSNLAVYGVI